MRRSWVFIHLAVDGSVTRSLATLFVLWRTSTAAFNLSFGKWKRDSLMMTLLPVVIKSAYQV